MKTVFIAIIFIMIISNFICYFKSRKYLKNAKDENDESNRNYKTGMMYNIISVVLSLLIILVGITAIVIYKFL